MSDRIRLLGPGDTGPQSPSQAVAQALEVLESQESLSGTGAFDANLVLFALAVLEEFDPSSFQEWSQKMTSSVSAATGQEFSENDLRLLVSTVSRGSGSGGQRTQGGGGSSTPQGQGGLVGAPPLPPLLEEDRGPAPIGVPRDFVAPSRLDPGARFRGGIDSAATGGPQEPRYFAGDQFEFQALPAQRIQAIQRDLERAGLLERDSYTPGFWDVPTAQAMELSMAYANRGGTTYQQVIAQLKSLPSPKKRRERLEFTPPPKLMPDPAAVAQDVKRTYRNRLGRDPTQAELREFSNFLIGQESARQDQAIDQLRREFFQENIEQVPRFDADFGAPTPTRVVQPESVQAIDPAARFAELFDQRLGPEIRRNERVADLVRANNNVLSSLFTMQGLVG